MIINNKIPLRYVASQIKNDMVRVLAIGVSAEVLLLQVGDSIPVMPWNVPAFLGTAISILLSFKMSQSYDRWWEARKIWGGIVNNSRNLLINVKALYVT